MDQSVRQANSKSRQKPRGQLSMEDFTQFQRRIPGAATPNTTRSINKRFAN
jgi:hypothetical protein